MQLWNKSCLITNIIRAYSSSSRLSGNHYESLGLTPKATQNDIKAAYYKLSMLHHPDKSKEESSTRKFRDITEAYEVLGNVKLKKIYDKGLLQGVHAAPDMYHPEPEPHDPELKFYKSRSRKQAVTTMDGKTPIYDFDAWSKQHYSDAFQKKQDETNKSRRREASNIARQEHTIKEAYLYFLTFLFTSLFVFTIMGESDYDVVAKSKTTNQPNSEQGVQSRHR